MIIPHIQSKMLVSQHLICCSFSNFFAHENFNNFFLLGTLHKNRISIKSVTPGLQNGKNLKNQTLNKVLISNFTILSRDIMFLKYLMSRIQIRVLHF